ncbi:MAG: hypothetical protein IIT86_05150, partial [Oscillospiraceae bacterium]|nr:hypothetical protein [Oscillospiraceae bacterium]
KIDRLNAAVFRLSCSYLRSFQNLLRRYVLAAVKPLKYVPYLCAVIIPQSIFGGKPARAVVSVKML